MLFYESRHHNGHVEGNRIKKYWLNLKYEQVKLSTSPKKVVPRGVTVYFPIGIENNQYKSHFFNSYGEAYSTTVLTPRGTTFLGEGASLTCSYFNLNHSFLMRFRPTWPSWSLDSENSIPGGNNSKMTKTARVLWKKCWWEGFFRRPHHIGCRNNRISGYWVVG